MKNNKIRVSLLGRKSHLYFTPYDFSLKKYQKAYSLTYPNEPPYAIATEEVRITLYGAEELRNTLRVNYELLDDDK